MTTLDLHDLPHTVNVACSEVVGRVVRRSSGTGAGSDNASNEDDEMDLGLPAAAQASRNTQNNDTHSSMSGAKSAVTYLDKLLQFMTQVQPQLVGSLRIRIR